MSLWISLAAAAALLFVYAEWIETRLRQINRYERTLHKPLARPVKVLHLTDTHFAGSNRALARFFDRLALEPADLVVLTGDIMDCRAGLEECLVNLKKLKPKYGIYAVFGNHDYYVYSLLDSITHNFPGQTPPPCQAHVERYREALESIGVRVMRNETDAVEIAGTPFLIHGLDDATTGQANIRETLANFDPRKVNLLLTHTVDVFLDIGQDEIDVSFSGHSHGGQIRFPFIGPIITHTRLGRKYASGLWRIQGALCCISRGIHASRFLHLRFLCPPEAIVLTLRGRA